MKRILTVASFVLLCLGITLVVYADVDPSTCDHTFYAVYDADHNPVIARYDDEYHYVLTRCSKCQKESTSEGFSHFMREADWDGDYPCRYFDNECHERREKCANCNYERLTKEEHSISYPSSVRYLNQNSHIVVYDCYSCGGEVECVEPHLLYSTVEHKKIDDTYHGTVYICSDGDCGYKTLREKATHVWSGPSCVQTATATTPGLMRYTCSVCFATKDVSFPYTPDGDYCFEYINDISFVYSTSKSVTIKLNAPLKGGVIQLKFGKKTYKKKITNNGTKIKIKLKKKPKWGTKFSVKLTYNGKTLYSGKEPVWYAKKIRTGMTKKQAKYTWGSPQRTGGSSGGWTYWYYEDGSYIGFKGGKVKFWRD